MTAHAPRPLIRVLAEVLFSANAAFAGISLLFCASFSAELPFVHLEVYLNHALGIRQTDLIRGYLTDWIPSFILAVFIWTILQFFRKSSVTQEPLWFIAGTAIVLSPTAIWTCGYERDGWSLQWPYKMIWGEALVVITLLFIFLKGASAASRRIGVLALFGHCVFWYWFTSGGFQPRLNWEMPGYAGPYGMLLGFCTVLGWGLYVYRLKKLRSESSSGEIPSAAV